MSSMLTEFQQMLGRETKQKGDFWCIPASISNALKLLGSNDFSQNTICDAWYAHKGFQPENDVNAPLKEMSFNVTKALQPLQKFNSQFEHEFHSDLGDRNPFDTTKAETALKFVGDHVQKNHPVIVSTWRVEAQQQTGKFCLHCCHMWLVLKYDDKSTATYHDPADDTLKTIPIRSPQTVTLAGKSYQLDEGLRGRITHTDYNCLAFWKK